MNYKIDIAGTSIALNVSRNDITVTNGIKYDIQMQFRNLDSDTSLDTEGDVFEPLYWLDVKVTPKEPTEYHSSLGVKAEKRNLAELQKFFEFIENNKRNLLISVDSRENCNEISDIIVRHFNYCDRMGRISRL